jgi:hypothetical protein
MRVLTASHLTQGARSLTRLTLSSASKVAEYPGRKNAFSLPAGQSCPFATPTCAAGCYAKKGRFTFRYVQKAYLDNYSALLNAGTVDKMTDLLVAALRRRRFKQFRIHVSGDFFSLDYAMAWKATCAAYATRQFWAYTHSTDKDILSVLATIPNLVLNLSCDRDNWKTMLERARVFPSLRLTYYSQGEKPDPSLYEHDPDMVVFVDHKVRGDKMFRGNCPAELGDRGGLPVAGACIKCQRCMVPRNVQTIKEAA